MPKKTTYSRSSAQRSRPKQKSFELVRPVSDEKVLESDAESEQSSAGSRTALKVEEIEGKVDTVEDEVEDEEVEKSTSKKPELAGKAASTKKLDTTKKAVSTSSASAGKATKSEETSSEAPKSAAARLAARREAAAQKSPQSHSHAISAENYAYVRKDLIFILILALIMFSAIIALHFIIGS